MSLVERKTSVDQLWGYTLSLVEDKNENERSHMSYAMEAGLEGV
jgi:hypothetical protein